MSRITAIVLISGVLSGCTTTEQADDSLKDRFVGKSSDEFFLQYGPPATSFEMQDGRTMYLWAEDRQSVYVPGTTTASVSVVGNTAWVNGWTSPGTTIDVQCQVRIVTRNGKIEEILSHKDSIGWWQLSRCNEIFGARK